MVEEGPGDPAVEDQESGRKPSANDATDRASGCLGRRRQWKILNVNGAHHTAVERTCGFLVDSECRTENLLRVPVELMRSCSVQT